MRSYLSNVSDKDRREFADQIKSIIRACTPSIKEHTGPLPSNIEAAVFGSAPWRLYGLFALNLFSKKLVRRHDQGKVEVYPVEDSGFQYDVITLNYDKVLESIIQHLSTHHLEASSRLSFRRNEAITGDEPRLAKLHGCVDDEIITLPTWNKQAHSTTFKTWALASTLLNGARELRFIGYSLPLADSYVRYLLKASCIGSDELSRVDVLCIDGEGGNVEGRYRQLFNSKGVRFKFKNMNSLDYLQAIWDEANKKTAFNWSTLEQAHAGLFSV